MERDSLLTTCASAEHLRTKCPFVWGTLLADSTVWHHLQRLLHHRAFPSTCRMEPKLLIQGNGAWGQWNVFNSPGKTLHISWIQLMKSYIIILLLTCNLYSTSFEQPDAVKTSEDVLQQHIALHARIFPSSGGPEVLCFVLQSCFAPWHLMALIAFGRCESLKPLSLDEAARHWNILDIILVLHQPQAS